MRGFSWNFYHNRFLFMSWFFARQDRKSWPVKRDVEGGAGSSLSILLTWTDRFCWRKLTWCEQNSRCIFTDEFFFPSACHRFFHVYRQCSDSGHVFECWVVWPCQRLVTAPCLGVADAPACAFDFFWLRKKNNNSGLKPGGVVGWIKETGNTALPVNLEEIQVYII